MFALDFFQRKVVNLKLFRNISEVGVFTLFYFRIFCCCFLSKYGMEK